MELQKVEELGLSLIDKQATHRDYERSVNLAKDYLSLITGEDVGRMLEQFIKREDTEMFEQRKRITQPITGAVAGSLIKPFYKVSRNDKLKKGFDFNSPSKTEAVKTMIKTFYGEQRKENKGLDFWLKTRFVELSFNDPNAWIVTEWVTPDAQKIAEPKPYEVTSEEAMNFEIKHNELNWLFVKAANYFNKYNEKGEFLEVAIGVKYTIYEKDNTVTFTEVCRNGYKKKQIDLKPNESFVEAAGKIFVKATYSPNLGYVPAFRVGYKRDQVTNGRTFVNPFHEAMPYFKKSIKTVSELDLTMALHTFPQKLQYVQKCTGISPQKKCSNGKIADGTECTACSGKGFKVHTTAQDAILLPMPDDKDQMIPLDSILTYKSPPIDLIKFQKEYIQDLKLDAHLAVYNSQMFASGELQVAKTATEIDSNMESIYDTLEPYTEKVSEVWKDFVYTFAKLANVEKPEDGNILHQFPSDLKLKTTRMLLEELKAANDSGAPSFMRDAINNDLADIIYTGDDVGKLKYETKHKFFPFNGKNPDEIAMLVASNYVSEFTKVLYSNFEAIFTDIEKEKPLFWFMESYAEQWTILSDKTKEYMDELNLSTDNVTLNFGSNTDTGLDTGAAAGDNDGTVEDEETE